MTCHENKNSHFSYYFHNNSNADNVVIRYALKTSVGSFDRKIK